MQMYIVLKYKQTIYMYYLYNFVKNEI